MRQNGNNSALRSLEMLFGSLGKVLGGCAKPIAKGKYCWFLHPQKPKASVTPLAVQQFLIP